MKEESKNTEVVEKPTKTEEKAAEVVSATPKDYKKFHPTDITNLKVEDAVKLAMKSRYIIRVLKEDGKDLPESRDYDTNRINVEVEKGVVTKAWGVW